jgi:hypothetical protein
MEALAVELRRFPNKVKPLEGFKGSNSIKISVIYHQNSFSELAKVRLP